MGGRSFVLGAYTLRCVDGLDAVEVATGFDFVGESSVEYRAESLWHVLVFSNVASAFAVNQHIGLSVVFRVVTDFNGFLLCRFFDPREDCLGVP